MLYLLAWIGRITLAIITISLYVGFCTFAVLGFRELRQRLISKQPRQSRNDN